LRCLTRGLNDGRVDGFRQAGRLLVFAIASIALMGTVMSVGTADARRTHRSRCPGERTSSADGKRFLRAVLCLQVLERRRHGLNSLGPRRALGKAAIRHARDMVRRGYFGHVSPAGSDPLDRALAAGYRGSRKIRVGENLLSWSAPLTAAAVIEKWMASPLHRRNILRRRWCDVGIALVRRTPSGARGLTVAVEFGRR
jgi:uncharacterized protein YkwD